MTCVQTCSAKFVEFQTPFPFKFARPGVQNTLNGPIPKGEWSRQQIVWRVRNWFWALVIPCYSRGDRATSWSHATRWWKFEGTVDIDGYTVWICMILLILGGWNHPILNKTLHFGQCFCQCFCPSSFRPRIGLGLLESLDGKPPAGGKTPILCCDASKILSSLIIKGKIALPNHKFVTSFSSLLRSFVTVLGAKTQWSEDIWRVSHRVSHQELELSEL